MFLSELSPGYEIEVNVERLGNLYCLNSKVQDTSDEYVFISPPSLNFQSFTLNARDQVSIVAFVDGSLMRWECEEWLCLNVGIVSLVRMKCGTKGSKYNRRQAYRVPIGIEVTADILQDKPMSIPLRIEDISFLGLGFRTKSEIPIGDTLTIFLKDGEWQFIITATIVRVVKPKGEQQVYFYGASITISNHELSRYISEKQREEIRRLNRIG